MLGRFELLITFLGAWLLTAIISLILKRWRRSKLPAGTIAIDRFPPGIKDQLPGTHWSRLGVAAGLGVNSFLTILVFCVTIFDFWETTAMLIAFDLPLLVNWVGILGIWITYTWAIAVMYFNVNYIPATRPMQGKHALYRSDHEEYVLATGGPYRWVRHPMYVSKVFFGLFLFLATGIWLTVLTLVAVAFLPAQARGEEEMLHDLFGDVYDDYVARTGRFFPKI
ncbi:MAG: methyltransferase family protein [Candidatus Thorarchaeota archaeon]